MNLLVVALLLCFGGLARAYQTVIPRVIQGGMGIRISSWQLAREVSQKGELGVISGTVLDSVLVRELQNGKKSHFPIMPSSSCHSAHLLTY